jgi:hypothetical protein
LAPFVIVPLPSSRIAPVLSVESSGSGPVPKSSRRIIFLSRVMKTTV